VTDPAVSSDANAARKWQPISSIDRRVLGVLVEKAKTTPDAYPLSYNALRVGCNQKNNRDPIMQLTEDDVQESMERLRPLGAAEEVQGSGRVSRLRHHLYEWLGVDKIELAVMAELLLRGAQTEGELRGRAARMEPIADLTALRPILASLKQKGLVISLTSEGRGHVVSHALYLPEEMDKVRRHVESIEAGGPATASVSRAATPSGAADHDELAGLREELNQMHAEIAELRQELQSVRDLMTQRGS
jgi:uncharacterized protein YceH (UPF0502 family)